MKTRTLTIYPNELIGLYDPSVEPTSEVLTAVTSWNKAIAAGGRAPNALDGIPSAAMTIDTNASAGKPRIDLALDRRLDIDFFALLGEDLREIYEAAERNSVRLLHDTTATWGTAVEVVVNKYMSGLFGRGRPYLKFSEDADNVVVSDNPNFRWGFGDWSYVAWIWMEQPTGSYDRMRIIEKWGGGAGYLVKIHDDKTVEVGLGGSAYTIAAPDIVWETEFHLGITFDRDANMTVFIDKVLQGTTDISDSSGVDLAGTEALAFAKAAGGTSQSFTGRRLGEAFFNRLLSLSDITDHHDGKVAVLADRGASQTELMPNPVDRDLSGANAWANVDWVSYTDTPSLQLQSDTAGQYCTLPVASAPMTQGKNHRLYYDASAVVASVTVKDFTGVQTFGTISADATQGFIEWTVDAGITGGYRIVAVADATQIVLDNLSTVQIGVVAEYPHDGFSLGQSKLLDASGNDQHGAVSGAEFRGTPDSTDRGFLLAELSTMINARYLFWEFNELAKTGLGNLALGQVMGGKKLVAAGVAVYAGDEGFPGIDLTESQGGAQYSNIRYDDIRGAWRLHLVAQTDDQLKDWQRVHRAAKKRPFLLGEDILWSDGTRERLTHLVWFNKPLTWQRTGSGWSIVVGILRSE